MQVHPAPSPPLHVDPPHLMYFKTRQRFGSFPSTSTVSTEKEGAVMGRGDTIRVLYPRHVPVNLKPPPVQVRM